MQLHPLKGQTSVSDPDHGHFEVSDGVLEVPEELGRRLHGTHVQGEPTWETSAERHVRLLKEEEERQRDPATLLAAVQKLTAATKGKRRG